MTVTAESQTNIEANIAPLLEQFVVSIMGSIVPVELATPEPRDEVVLCEIKVEGVSYKLTCQPCINEPTSSPALSPREQEIVRLVMKGLSTRGIAGVLEISPWTVCTHIRHVFSKLDVNSRAEMVAQVLGEGIFIGEGSIEGS